MKKNPFTLILIAGTMALAGCVEKSMVMDDDKYLELSPAEQRSYREKMEARWNQLLPKKVAELQGGLEVASTGGGSTSSTIRCDPITGMAMVWHEKDGGFWGPMSRVGVMIPTDMDCQRTSDKPMATADIHERGVGRDVLGVLGSGVQGVGAAGVYTNSGGFGGGSGSSSGASAFGGANVDVQITNTSPF